MLTTQCVFLSGVYPVKPPLPAIGGSEGVGEIIETGPSVTKLAKGDWVIPAIPGKGTWCTDAAFEEHSLLKIRNDIPMFCAATLAINPATAYRMLVDFVKLTEGDLVVQNGGNSGVGQAVIQLAKEMGYITVNIVRNRKDITEMKDFLKVNKFLR